MTKLSALTLAAALAAGTLSVGAGAPAEAGTYIKTVKCTTNHTTGMKSCVTYTSPVKR